jgi:hypothetical protein
MNCSIATSLNIIVDQQPVINEILLGGHGSFSA